MKWSSNHHHPMLLSLVFCIKVEKNLHRWNFPQHTSARRNVLNTEGTDSIVRLMLVRNTSSPGVETAEWCASSGNFLQIRKNSLGSHAIQKSLSIAQLETIYVKMLFFTVSLQVCGVN